MIEACAHSDDGLCPECAFEMMHYLVGERIKQIGPVPAAFERGEMIGRLGVHRSVPSQVDGILDVLISELNDLTTMWGQGYRRALTDVREQVRLRFGGAS